MRADEDTVTPFPQLTGIPDSLSTENQWPSQNFEKLQSIQSHYRQKTNCPKNLFFTKSKVVCKKLVQEKNTGKKEKTKKVTSLHNLLDTLNSSQNDEKDNCITTINLTLKRIPWFKSVYFLMPTSCCRLAASTAGKKVMQWKKLQPHCSCASANRRAPHWLCRSDNA